MAQDNFDRQTEDTSRAFDRTRKYLLGPISSYTHTQGPSPDHPAVEMDCHSRPSCDAHHGIDRRVMKLAVSPEFSGQKQGVRQATFLKNPDALDEGIDSSLINDFFGRVEVTSQPRSNLVNVSFACYESDMAENVVNTMATSSIDLNIALKYKATQQTSEWLEKRLGAIETKVDKAEEKLNQYAGKDEIIFLETKVHIDGKGSAL